MPSQKRPTAKNRQEARKALPKLRVSRAFGMVAPAGVIQQGRIDHAIAHTARILEALKNPDISAASRANLEDALEDYKDLIHQAGADAVKDSHETLAIVPPADLTADQVAAAVSHLEG